MTAPTKEDVERAERVIDNQTSGEEISCGPDGVDITDGLIMGIAQLLADERERAEKESELNRLQMLYALALMWNQYCAKGGHLFMCAGEACLTALEENNIGGADDMGGDIDTDKIEALIQAALADGVDLKKP